MDNKNFEWTINNRCFSSHSPAIMGIINATPDSFHTASRWHYLTEEKIEEWVANGVDILDVGGQSTRPGSERIHADEEWTRIEPLIKSILHKFPHVLLSIDTYHQSVAEKAMMLGAHLINDVSAGSIDEQLLPWILKNKIPYVLMHMQGTLANMQVNPQYSDVTQEILQFFSQKLVVFENNHFVAIDPGFGFGKTLNHNFEILQNLSSLQSLGRPILAGASRKKMIQQATETNADQCGPGSLVAHTIACMHGASIIRTHDVLESMQMKKIMTHTFQEF